MTVVIELWEPHRGVDPKLGAEEDHDMDERQNKERGIFDNLGKHSDQECLVCCFFSARVSIRHL